MLCHKQRRYGDDCMHALRRLEPASSARHHKLHIHAADFIHPLQTLSQILNSDSANFLQLPALDILQTSSKRKWQMRAEIMPTGQSLLHLGSLFRSQGKSTDARDLATSIDGTHTDAREIVKGLTEMVPAWQLLLHLGSLSLPIKEKCYSLQEMQMQLQHCGHLREWCQQASQCCVASGSRTVVTAKHTDASGLGTLATDKGTDAGRTLIEMVPAGQSMLHLGLLIRSRQRRLMQGT